MMRQTQQTTNMLLAAFMKMNPDLLQALPAASPSPPLMIGSRASGSLLSGSSTREAEAAQLPENKADEAIPPAVVYRRIQEDRLTSPASLSYGSEKTKGSIGSARKTRKSRDQCSRDRGWE